MFEPCREYKINLEFGDAANNRRENLRLVCPNCDSQLDTYKSKNKNSARKKRYLKNYKN